MEIENFMPKYPNIVNFDDPLFNPYDEDFSNVIVTKKEFQELKLSKNEETSLKRGEYYNHQKMIARFMSSLTPYNELLVFHEMGTGKTCTAVSVIEKLRYEKNSPIKQALVIARGSGLLKNFVNELLFKCTDGRYIPANYELLTDNERIYRVKKETNKFYTFYTFERFARMLSNKQDSDIIQQFSNTVVVIDEVHNIREKEAPSEKKLRKNAKKINQIFFRDPLYIYKQFHRFLHIIKHSKILLMSGTVMKDDPSEFASVMNLILPLDQQFPVDREFMSTYFDLTTARPIMLPGKYQDFVGKIKGRVSYLKAMSTNVKKAFVGVSVGKLRYFKVALDEMSEFQSAHYAAAYRNDDNHIFNKSRQAILFVFPDGTYGKDGYTQKRYVVKTKKMYSMANKPQYKNIYTLGPELLAAIGYGDVNSKLNNLYKYSSKYTKTIRTILNNLPTKALVYCEFVHGGGAILFSKILELFGFSRAEGTERTIGLRYAILTAETTTHYQSQNIIKRFNNPDNVDGEYIAVIIGSRIISEGFTLKDIRQEFILTPHWNYAETSQVIARGWRLGAHDNMIKKGYRNLSVNIFQQVSVPSASFDVPSIDLHMYEISERKDVFMKILERAVKKGAFDCALNVARNYTRGYDYQRECDYAECQYTCDGNVMTPLDTETYNLYYSMKSRVKEELASHFAQHSFIYLRDLRERLSFLDEFEIISALCTFVNDNTQFTNQLNKPVYARIAHGISDTIVYATTDITVQNYNSMSVYYALNMVISSQENFNKVLDRMYEDKLPDMIESMFVHSDENTIAILNTLPSHLQRIVLEACLEAQLLGKSENVAARQTICNYFKGNYDTVTIEDETYTIIWLHKIEFGIVYAQLNPDSGRIDWIDCIHKEETFMQQIAHHIDTYKDLLLTSPIGYYGLYNRLLDDFCLRDISTAKDEATRKFVDAVDLRKITAGRRCIDFDLPTLVDIIARRIKMTPPSEYLVNTSIDVLVEKVKSKKKFFKEQDLESIESMKTFLYWSEQRRNTICAAIRSWLEERNLVEMNTDCGTQRKQRSRIVR